MPSWRYEFLLTAVPIFVMLAIDHRGSAGVTTETRPPPIWPRRRLTAPRVGAECDLVAAMSELDLEQVHGPQVRAITRSLRRTETSAD
jgi:hypothetical protein